MAASTRPTIWCPRTASAMRLKARRRRSIAPTRWIAGSTSGPTTRARAPPHKGIRRNDRNCPQPYRLRALMYFLSTAHGFAATFETAQQPPRSHPERLPGVAEHYAYGWYFATANFKTSADPSPLALQWSVAVTAQNVSTPLSETVRSSFQSTPAGAGSNTFLQLDAPGVHE